MAYLATPQWVRERTRPWLEAGAKCSGRDLGDFDLAVEVICSAPGHPYTRGLLESIPVAGDTGRLRPIPGQPPILGCGQAP